MYFNTKVYTINGEIDRIICCNNSIFSDSEQHRIKPRGFSDISDSKRDDSEEQTVRSDSLRRAKQTVFDIGNLNLDLWKYFVTFTFDPKLINRSDPLAIRKAFQTYTKNRVSRNGLCYLAIPEYHKKGGIHIHALVNDSLKLVDSGRLNSPGHKNILISTADKYRIPIDDRQTIYNVSDWRFGFSSAVELYGTVENFIKYTLKYISKDANRIFGNFYLAGGRIERDVPFTLVNVDYNALSAKEFHAENSPLYFKYPKSIDELKGVQIYD